MIMIEEKVWNSAEFYLACKEFCTGYGNEDEDFFKMIRILFPHQNIYRLYNNSESHFVIEDRDI